MPIRVVCNQCQKSFRTADENAGKRTKCPDCGQPLTIPQVGDEPAAVARPSAAGNVGTSAAGNAAPAAGTLSGFGGSSDGSSAGAGSASDGWHLAMPDGQQHGPISKTELDRWVAEGRVQAQFNIFCQGWTEWRPAAELYPQLIQQQQPMGASGYDRMGDSGTGSTERAQNITGGISGVGTPAQSLPSVNPYAAPAAVPIATAIPFQQPVVWGGAQSIYVTHAPAQTDGPGVISVILGGLSLVILVFGCLFSCFGGFILYPLSAVLAATGLICAFFGRGNLRVAGITMNVLVLIPSLMLIVIMAFGLFGGAAGVVGGTR